MFEKRKRLMKLNEIKNIKRTTNELSKTPPKLVFANAEMVSGEIN